MAPPTFKDLARPLCPFPEKNTSTQPLKEAFEFVSLDSDFGFSISPFVLPNVYVMMEP
jgi:hypothetical protein